MDYSKIIEADLLYDRTNNFTGIPNFNSVADRPCPANGSSVEFLSKDFQLITNHNYLDIIPIGINNLVGIFNMRYELKEGDAKKMANFLEQNKGK